MQEVVWCSCGHGEFLPIVKCQQGEKTGDCWLVLHGDHRIVVPESCIYCLLHYNQTKLRLPAKPEEQLARQIEQNEENRLSEARLTMDLPLREARNTSIDPQLLQLQLQQSRAKSLR